VPLAQLVPRKRVLPSGANAIEFTCRLAGRVKAVLALLAVVLMETTALLLVVLAGAVEVVTDTLPLRVPVMVAVTTSSL
jgi:hypothetical protein